MFLNLTTHPFARGFQGTLDFAKRVTGPDGAFVIAGRPLCQDKLVKLLRSVERKNAKVISAVPSTAFFAKARAHARIFTASLHGAPILKAPRPDFRFEV